MRNSEISKRTLPLLLAGPLVVLALVLFSGYDYNNKVTTATDSAESSLPKARVLEKILDEDESTRIAELTVKLKPKSFDIDNSTTLTPHQFLHMHHMKTGGTSMDGLLRCAMGRMKKDQEVVIPYYNIHECSRNHYSDCKSGQDSKCMEGMKKSAVLSYCAPLKDLPAFSWIEPVQAITVLRHPVDRVWSMFRFQTKSCYKCKPLLDIYKALDAGDASEYGDMCMDQIQNHETANLLSTEWDENASDEELINEAVDNMKNFFTMIGLTEQLNTTVKMAGEVFPFMKSSVDWSETKCELNHRNASPQNNRCGPGSTHWDLASHPDEETRKAIEAHNQLDMKLYEAAVQHFELQKRALEVDEESL